MIKVDDSVHSIACLIALVGEWGLKKTSKSNNGVIGIVRGLKESKFLT